MTAALNPKPWRRTTGIRQNRGSLRHKRLPRVDLRHGAVITAESFADVLQYSLVRVQLAP